ncbi:MAG: AAA family ATPase [Bythopirellula sp.]|nr:AAA family ATPase [Bythopirellula sp.]
MSTDLLQSHSDISAYYPFRSNQSHITTSSTNPRSAAQEQASQPVRFIPVEPETLADTGLNEHELEALVLKSLLKRGTISGRGISESLHLPRPILQQPLERLRAELMIGIKGSSGLEDFVFQLTEAGFDRARRENQQCSYVGSAPVPLETYLAAIAEQSLQSSQLDVQKLKEAFRELRLSDVLLSQLGQAINDGRGMFLYGTPGNGKTSLSELVVSAYGEFIWIPRTITIDGELVRLYDPRSHEAVAVTELENVRHDRRWILIRRPTIVVGGELTMAQLDLQFNPSTGISEAPVQLRANGGALVVDDFGRQRMPTSELLNRLIVPMEKNHDYLNLSSGRQVSVPFDMLLVFSTNLEPSDLVDEAFLRRIPYKIEVSGPTREEFVTLFQELATKAGCQCEQAAVHYLLDTHYQATKRPLRFCHPRDLLRQIRNYCEFHKQPLAVSNETLDVAVRNYFAGL